MKVRLRDGSGERHYKCLWADVDRHGNVRIYFVRGDRPKIRLREAPGTPAFDEEYRQAFQGLATLSQPAPRRAAPETLQWLCQQYYASPAFQKALGDSTRRMRRGTLDATRFWRAA